MHVLFVTPEVAPYSSTGDLAETAAELPRALRELGYSVTVVSPCYASIDPERFGLARRIRKVAVPVGADTVEVGLVEGKFGKSDVGVILVDHPPSFGRSGIYGDAAGDYPDNHRRFHLFCAAVIRIVDELGLVPDLVHACEWQSGLLPLLARQGPLATSGLFGTKMVFSVQDPSFAGRFPASVLDEIGVDRALYTPEGIELYGQLSYLKAGLVFSDRILMPSPTSSREALEDEHGGGLHGLFAARRGVLAGVLGGLDTTSWNPATDHRLAVRFGPDDLGPKAECKRALQAELGLPTKPQTPLLVMAGSLDEARGVGLLLEALPSLPRANLQVALVGRASPALEGRIRQAAAEGLVAFLPSDGKDGALLRRALGGADSVLIPARHEPSGLLSLKAMRYGAVPVVRRTGVLADSVVDYDPPTETGTGFVFSSFDPTGLTTAIFRLLSLYESPNAFATLARNGMRQRLTWEATARRHSEIYEKLLGR
jgi:starch synthase